MKRIALIALLLLGCGESDNPGVDAGVVADGGQRDAGASQRDAGSLQDAGDTVDAGDPRRDGFGIITGACGELDDELTAMTFALVENAIDFEMDPYDDTDMALLTEGGREIIRDGNAGGSSLLSEVFSYEVLARCEGAELVATETEVEYVDMMGKITDLVVTIGPERIGVSVTRAVKFPFDAVYTVADADMLLSRKLADVLLSSANVKPAFAWTKQILHVIAYAPGHADALRTAFDALDPAVKADTILFITVSDGDDAFLY